MAKSNNDYWQPIEEPVSPIESSAKTALRDFAKSISEVISSAGAHEQISSVTLKFEQNIVIANVKIQKSIVLR